MKLYQTVVTLFSALFLFSPTYTQANTRAGSAVFFSETGHTLAYNFRAFYDLHGGLPIFGLPITEVFLEDHRPVQYFERVRLEWHADIAEVLIGHLGRWAALEHENLPPFQPQTDSPAPMGFFPQTGHTIHESFLPFWRDHGGLATFGYPLSEAFPSADEQDSQAYTVQYFERARFEWRPELPLPYRVTLSLLGRQYLAAHPPPEEALHPALGPDQAWSSLRPTHITIPRIGVDTAITPTGFSYTVWDVPRSTAAYYWPISGHPGTTGNIVIAGHVGYRGVIFNQLPLTQKGDDIVVFVGERQWHYVTDEILTLQPHEVWVMNPTETETLTLITCVPIGSYSHRLIVRAVPAPYHGT